VLVRPRPAAERRAATARQRRYRARLKSGTMPITIEIDAAIVTMLVESNWLAERDAGDRLKIAAALTAMIADTAAKFL
jgi:hypothetical protein